MWQMSSVLSHESAQRNDAGHLICENDINFSSEFHVWNDEWLLAFPDEWKHETIGSNMAVLF